MEGWKTFDNVQYWGALTSSYAAGFLPASFEGVGLPVYVRFASSGCKFLREGKFSRGVLLTQRAFQTLVQEVEN